MRLPRRYDQSAQIAAFAPESSVVDQLRPEPFRLVDRDAMQLVVVGATEPPHQPRDVCIGDESGTRRPDEVVHASSLGRMRARLFTPENRKWWTLIAVSFGL